MPINLVYEDPTLLGEATRDAYGLARRRANLEHSIDNQLEADKANAQLGLGYDQLEASMAQRELDRNADLANSAANREFHAQQTAAGNAADLNRIRVAGEQQQANVNAELSQRQKMRMQQLNGAREKLHRERQGGLWQNRENEWNAAMREIDNAEFDVKMTPPPQQKTPQQVFDEQRVDGPDGYGIFVPDGRGGWDQKFPEKDEKTKAEAAKAKADADAKAKEHADVQRIATDLMGKMVEDPENNTKKPLYDTPEAAADAAIKIHRRIQAALNPPETPGTTPQAPGSGSRPNTATPILGQMLQNVDPRQFSPSSTQYDAWRREQEAVKAAAQGDNSAVGPNADVPGMTTEQAAAEVKRIQGLFDPATMETLPPDLASRLDEIDTHHGGALDVAELKPLFDQYPDRSRMPPDVRARAEYLIKQLADRQKRKAKAAK